MEYTIEPIDLIQDAGWKFQRKRNWYVVKVCPFCYGGQHADQNTFIVHASDGNFSCHRTKCGESGSFWQLIESRGGNPREFIERSPKPKRKKKWMYR